MLTVRVTTGSIGRQIPRQTYNSSGLSKDGRYSFVFDDGDNCVEEADFWIVRNKYIRHKTSTRVAPENTILMLSEPYSIVSFPSNYTSQFALVCSCQEETKHPNVIFRQAALPWFVGINDNNECGTVKLNYDSLKHDIHPQKEKMISVISSNKAFTYGHVDRICFVEKLKKRYGNRIDYFGRGFNSFTDKWDVLAPYKYHIALENSSSKYYWTEKLSDCFLAETYPIYYGCTNVNDYFSAGAMSYINILNAEESFRVIDNILDNDPYESALPSIIEAKNDVLDKYNIISLMSECCDMLNPNAEKKETTLYPANTLFDSHNIYKQLVERNLCKLKYYLSH